MEALGSSATAIITRPPEIIACTKIKGMGMDVFVIFDSHPRSSYPSGAGLILSTSIDQAATRLASILPAADDRLLSQGGLQWQAQLLNNVSGHIFVSNGPPGDMRRSVIESSLAVLRLQADLAALKQENARLTSENEMLEGDVQRLEDALSGERKKVTSLQASSKVTQSRSGRPIFVRPTNAIAGPSRLPHLTYSSSSSSSNGTLIQNRLTSSSLYDATEDDLLEHEWELDRVNTAAALELQQSFDVEDIQLRDQMQALASTTSHNFSCSICMEEQPLDNIVELDCNHPICRACVRGHVCSKIDDHRFPVLCPVCMTEQDNRQPGGLYIF